MVDASQVSMLVAFMAGLFSFLSPCVLPLVPSYLSLITGMSLDELQAIGEQAPRRAWVAAHSVAFVVGFATVFVALGASLGAASRALAEHRDLIRWGGGVLILVFGLLLSGLLRLPWLGRTRQVPLRGQPAGLLGSILTLAGTTGTADTGVALLVAYSAGLALPFVVSSLALGAFLTSVRRFRSWIPVVERAAGVLLLAVGLLVLTDGLAVLNSVAGRLTPGWLVERL